jgi:hypothetical protein
MDSKMSNREFVHLVSQMSTDELRAYLKESLFMSFNRSRTSSYRRVLRRARREGSDENDGEDSDLNRGADGARPGTRDRGRRPCFDELPRVGLPENLFRERRMQRMPPRLHHQVALNGVTDQRQVADDVENLVADVISSQNAAD